MTCTVPECPIKRQSPYRTPEQAQELGILKVLFVENRENQKVYCCQCGTCGKEFLIRQEPQFDVPTFHWPHFRFVQVQAPSR